MGLDMYLTREISLANYNFDPAGQELSRKILKALGMNRPEQREQYANGTLSINLPEVYWRKANAIHNWFVTNTQNDIDECQESAVSVEQLAELRDLCKEVLAAHDPETSEQKLPTQAGFFFGQTNYDDHYYEALEHTVRNLDAALNSPLGGSFTYSASW